MTEDLLQQAILDFIDDRLQALTPLAGLNPGAHREATIANSTVLAQELLSDDPRLAAEAARTIMDLWPPDTDPPAWWWAEPLGCTIMLAGNEALSFRQAGWCLGVSKQMAHSLTQRGHLDRHPTLPGVTAASVKRRVQSRAPN